MSGKCDDFEVLVIYVFKKIRVTIASLFTDFKGYSSIPLYIVIMRPRQKHNSCKFPGDPSSPGLLTRSLPWTLRILASNIAPTPK